MNRLELAAQLWGRILSEVAEADRGFVAADMLVVRAYNEPHALIIVPMGQPKPTDAERAQHARLRLAGYRVVPVRSVAELDLALSDYCREQQHRARVAQMRAALRAIERPVLRRVA